ncbi:hypothetical protein mgb1_009 [Bacillus phage MG-B1]|uniref:Uncharacterized protein n=1 Tax=Bacillus phage MG-B1 TaxID=1309583 RepID=M4W9P0_9CAUD|nr:hypothetical protein mgb1_009 [Bacillus phage MG-B1]AGI10598.1 hypothetical protein mgb1_009 [Bacillus phage MG-B1]
MGTIICVSLFISLLAIACVIGGNKKRGDWE